MATVTTRKISDRLHAVQFDGSPDVSTVLARINGEDDEYGNCDLFSLDNLQNDIDVRDGDWVIFLPDESEPVFYGLLDQYAFIDLFDDSPEAAFDID